MTPSTSGRPAEMRSSALARTSSLTGRDSQPSALSSPSVPGRVMRVLLSSRRSAATVPLARAGPAGRPGGRRRGRSFEKYLTIPGPQAVPGTFPDMAKVEEAVSTAAQNAGADHADALARDTGP